MSGFVVHREPFSVVSVTHWEVFCVESNRVLLHILRYFHVEEIHKISNIVSNHGFTLDRRFVLHTLCRDDLFQDFHGKPCLTQRGSDKVYLICNDIIATTSRFAKEDRFHDWIWSILEKYGIIDGNWLKWRRELRKTWKYCISEHLSVLPLINCWKGTILNMRDRLQLLKPAQIFWKFWS